MLECRKGKGKEGKLRNNRGEKKEKGQKVRGKGGTKEGTLEGGKKGRCEGGRRNF